MNKNQSRTLKDDQNTTAPGKPVLELLKPLSNNEKTNESKLKNWLISCGIRTDSEWQTGNGPVDIYLPNRRILIETKSPSKLKNGPYKKISGESAYEQLQRYIHAIRKNEQSLLSQYTNTNADISSSELTTSWIGCVTDCKRWWIWEWDNKNQMKGSELPDWKNVILNEKNIGRLESIFMRTAGKEWAPSDFQTLFDEYEDRLIEIYKVEKDVPETITQKQLWLTQLKASGNEPKSDDQVKIFVKHTLLILITRLITNTLNISRDNISDDGISTGFVEWVSHNNYDFICDLEALINKYDWRHDSRDILRRLYEYIIQEEHRKSFGEFYTPDWMAEWVCSKIIDDDYITEQIANFRKEKTVLGILDPCCGSGTFLVHSINRILTSEPFKKAKFGKPETARFLSKMILGIDIHPVAVEMARNNIQRLIPNIDPETIQIYQGDSLLINRSTEKLHSIGGDNIVILSTKNTVLCIPKGFLHSNNELKTFVASAVEGNEIPIGIGSNLTSTEFETLKTAYKTLIKIIKEERNGVWYWYILNQVAPVLIREKKVKRIVSNPPWVSAQEIRDDDRKKNVVQTAKDEKLFVGSSSAARFDISMLAVQRGIEHYLNNGRCGWVLPQGAMLGANNWKKLLEKYESKITEKHDFGRLPFPNTPTCVLFMDGEGSNGKIIQKSYRNRSSQKGKLKLKKKHSDKIKYKINVTDNWYTVSKKIKSIPILKIKQSKSKYVGRHGASLQPKNLIKINESSIIRQNGFTSFETEPTFKKPWKDLKSRQGTVPNNYVKAALISSGMRQYNAELCKYVIPIDGNGNWYANKDESGSYWYTVKSLYAKNKGIGKHTPPTLEERLDFNNGLTKQFDIQSEWRVAYNAVGDYLYGAIIPGNTICGPGIISIYTESENEAKFLTVLLNASCLHDAFVAAQQTDRNFHLHIFANVPLPKYDDKNKTHQKIKNLYDPINTAISRYVNENPELNINQLREKIRVTLHAETREIELYKLIKIILPHQAKNPR